jgi:hypothetical protein
VADGRNGKAHFSEKLVVGLALDHAAQDQDLALAELAAARLMMFDRQGSNSKSNPIGLAHKG